MAQILTHLAHPPHDLTRLEVLRGIVFGFAAFAVLYSLDMSAAATIAAQAQTPDRVDLRSLAKHHHGQEYILGQDKDLIQRAEHMEELVTLTAQHADFSLHPLGSAHHRPLLRLYHYPALGSVTRYQQQGFVHFPHPDKDPNM